MQEDLIRIRYWFDKHFLVLSEKIKHMVFGIWREYNFDENQIYHRFNCGKYYNAIALDKVNEIKYLGLIINSDFS